MQNHSDAELLREFAARRTDTSFEELVRRHGPMVLAVCRRILGHTHDAEDAAQAAFLVLAQKASEVARSKSLLSGWLYYVATHVAMHARDSSRARRSRELAAATAPRVATTELDDAMTAALDEALAELPEKYRVPVVLHHLSGHTQDEAARMLGCKPSALSMRLVRARDMLRERLGQRGIIAGASVLTQLETLAPVVPTFITLTTQGATSLAAGHAAAGAISPAVIELTSGGLKMLYAAKVKWVATVSLMTILGVAGMGTIAYQALADRPRLADAVETGEEKPQPPNNDRTDRAELSEMIRLAKQAYENALGRYNRGLAASDDVCIWSRRWMEAEVALSGADKNRELMREHLTRMKIMLDLAKARERAGQVTLLDVIAAEYAVAETERWIKLAK
jgi:RNA polymerase sigma factor (sigma-70 family)